MSSISILIDWIQSLITRIAETTWSVDSVPAFMSWTERPMRTPVFWAASPDFEARLRTSLATTRKPFPAAPARAASTEAFNDRIFVWRAMSSIVFTMLLILTEDWSIFLVASISCAIFSSASMAYPFALSTSSLALPHCTALL